MIVWLHWIGAVYYTPRSFIAEAEKMGVSRRVPKRDLKMMNWGDKIYCVTKEKREINPVVFAYFFVEQIYGLLTKDLTPEILGKIYYIDDPQDIQTEERGCGDLQPGGLYAMTSATVEKLAEYHSQPQIRGGLKVLPKPWPMIMGMPFSRGFRKFDEKRFLADIAESPGRPKLRNMYYA